jgi:uncharacterized membrane protein YhaH (DUF805 family)
MMFAWQFGSGVATYLLFFSASLFRVIAVLLAVAAPFLVFLTSLVAQRSHDIGWSAAIPLTVFVITVAAQASTYFYFSVGGGHILNPGPGANPFLSIAFGASMIWIVLVLVLAFAPGQQQENRFGPPPKPVA